MIEFDNRQDKFEVDDKILKLVELAVNEALKFENFNMDYEISVVFTDNNGIKEINREFRGIDKETDVLSFPMLEYDDGYEESGEIEIDVEDINPETGCVVLGDIVISLEKVKEQSVEYEHTFERELSFLVVHSVLHLLGYDHINEDDRLIMRDKEEKILSSLGQIR